MLEVCVDSVQSAIAAAKGGACRIELCSALSEGGLTPTPGLLQVLKKDLKIQIPVFCMLRPRRGNDFVYSDEEMNSILYDMEILKNYGSDGFVFGSLTPDREINIDQSKRVVTHAGGLPCTFHRAFDLTKKGEMHANCKLLYSLGFSRILTSGFESSAEKGLESIKDLVDKHSDLIIMPGAGISPCNVQKILKETKCREYHASARQKVVQPGNISSPEISMGGGKDDAEPYLGTDQSVVEELCHLAKRVCN